MHSVQSMYMAGIPAQPQRFQGVYPLLYGDRPQIQDRPIECAQHTVCAHETHRKKRYTFAMMLVLNVVLAMFFCMYNTAAFAYASEEAQMNRMLLVSELEDVEDVTDMPLLSESLSQTYVPSFNMMNIMFENTAQTIEEANAPQTEIIVVEDESTPLARPATEEEAHDIAVDTLSTEPVVIEDERIAPVLEQTPIEYRYILPANTLDVNGTQVPYVHCVKADACPDFGAGLWEGDDDVNDGSFSYFVGHNPGDFTCVYNLRRGDYVNECDCKGQIRTYYVAEIYEVPDTISFDELKKRLIPEGECLVMQTCISVTSDHYRIVVCR